MLVMSSVGVPIYVRTELLGLTFYLVPLEDTPLLNLRVSTKSGQLQFSKKSNMWGCRCLFRHIPILEPIPVPPILAMTLPAFWWQNGQVLAAERRSLDRGMTFR